VNLIRIQPGPNSWLATYSGPAFEHIKPLFGTTTLPLPFTLDAPVDVVLADMQTRFPGAFVRAGIV
jgi:hypothetical protein